MREIITVFSIKLKATTIIETLNLTTVSLIDASMYSEQIGAEISFPESEETPEIIWDFAL